MNQPEISRHHLWYPRRHYKTPSERKLRNHEFNIIRMNHQAHGDLHAVLQPPLKLTHQQMIGTLCFMEELSGEPLQPSERIDEIARYLEGRSIRETKVARNLFQQGIFIAEFGV